MIQTPYKTCGCYKLFYNLKNLFRPRMRLLKSPNDEKHSNLIVPKNAMILVINIMEYEETAPRPEERKKNRRSRHEQEGRVH